MPSFYPAVLEKTADGFSVWFPDFDGCASGGGTEAEAAAAAEDALSLHIAGMIEDGAALPAPTPLSDIRRGDADEYARILVRAELPSRSLRVNISIDEGLLARIDASAKRLGMSRSAYLASAARVALHDDAKL